MSTAIFSGSKHRGEKFASIKQRSLYYANFDGAESPGLSLRLFMAFPYFYPINKHHLVASIHNISIEGLNGKEILLSQFKGKKLLIVNVASECDYTPQYGQLEELYEQYQDSLAILGCPCNDFGGQEPLVEEAIGTFCQTMYQVTFPLSKKINIRSNPVHPLYQWLTGRDRNGVTDSEVTWNFQKFALSPDGQLEHVFTPETSPLDDQILNWIAAA